jgi:hypothetical protein
MGGTLSKLGRNDEARDVLGPLVSDCARLRGDANPETQTNRLWLVKVLIDLGDYSAAREELTRLFDTARATGGWRSREAKERTEQYWRAVAPDDMPE